MSANMRDLNGWVQTTCMVADLLRNGTRPMSSLTDPDGLYGTPVVYTEWAERDTETPILRDYRWPDVDCKHYVPAPVVARPAPQTEGDRDGDH